jgi:SAM-dependent methyltransferase
MSSESGNGGSYHRGELAAWERLGETDPLWAIVSRPEMRGGRWDVDEFFETGKIRVRELFHKIPSLEGLTTGGRALDFGCGVGRLTQALADRFPDVVGVDAAASMIREANRLNRHGDRVRYLVNTTDDLGQFPSASFDLVVADIVLQHIRRRQALRFIGEFLRVLRPRGRIVFQAPAGLVSRWIRWIPVRVTDPAFNWGRNLVRRIRRSDLPGWESHWIPVRAVRSSVEAAGGRILLMFDEPPIHGRLENHLYVVGRGEPPA